MYEGSYYLHFGSYDGYINISAGMEYNLSQLVDVCAALVGVCDLDAASTPSLRHALLTLHPAVWNWPVLPAVRLGHGPGARTAKAYRLHEPETDGT